MNKEYIGSICITEKYIRRFKTVLLYYFENVAKNEEMTRKIITLFKHKNSNDYKSNFVCDVYDVYVYKNKSELLEEFILKRKAVNGKTIIKVDTRKGKIYRNNKTYIDFNYEMLITLAGYKNLKKELQENFGNIISSIVIEAEYKNELWR